MTRRKLVALVSAGVLLLIGLVVMTTGLFVTRTQAGRDKLREVFGPWVVSKLAPNGKAYVGHIGGDFINGITIDSIAIYDKHGELFLSTGPVSLEWNWRDIIDQRLYIRKANVEHPYVHIIQHADFSWNFKEIWASKTPQLPTPQTVRTRGWGDYIVVDSTTTRDATFLLTLSWTPDDTLRGAVRDSVIRYHLATPAKAVTKTFDGYGRTYAWRNGHGLLSHVRLADPDSDRKFGREFDIATLSVDEYEPTFKFRNLQGTVQHRGDSLWLQVPHFEMPASVAHAKGKVWWGSDRPVRYAIDIHGDSVSLNDVNWVYPTLPRTGGGTLDLAIRNDPANEKIIDFRLLNMDVRTTGSHLKGDMWFGTGAPVLLVRHVNMQADPVDFDFVRTLDPKPFPVDWRGQIYGSVKARGGPLTHFYIDDARGRFEDAHVRGAVSRFAGKGELDILEPAFTAFHGFDVDAQSIDLRTIQYLYPAFPRLNGFASGTARLDSSWLDVRFSNAHLALQNGPGEPSQFSGFGRITYGDKYMSYDVSLNAEPLNLTMLARSPTFEALPARGLMSGPIRANGVSPDLELAASLQGNNGALSFDGRVDLDSVGGYGLHGRGQFSALNVASLLEKPTLPVGTISGRYELQLDSIGPGATTRGLADVDIERTVLDSVRVYPSHARVRFAEGKMIVDSLRVHTDAATLTAYGAIGLPHGSPDSLRFAIDIDSLGGLRPYISTRDSTSIASVLASADSLNGSLTLSGTAVGTLDVLGVRGKITGHDLYMNKDRAVVANGEFAFKDVFGRRRGTLSLRGDTVTVLGVALYTVGGKLEFTDSTHATFDANAVSKNGPTAVTGGTWTKANGTQRVALDSLTVTVDADRWTLAAPTLVTIDSAGTRIDSLLLHNRDSATIALSAVIPEAGTAFGRLRASRIPLRDVGTLAQLSDTLFGVGDLNATVSGTKSAPVITADAALSAVRFSGVDIDRIGLTGGYENRRFNTTMTVDRGGHTSLTANASLPYDVTLPLRIRARNNDPITGSLKADTTDLVVLRPLFGNALDTLRGKFWGDVAASGTMRAKVFQGNVFVRDGIAGVHSLGVTLDALNADITGGVNAAGIDSMNVVASASTGKHEHVALNGWIRDFADASRNLTTFNLKMGMDSLHAYNKRTVANLFLSTPDSLHLTGTLATPVLEGRINVDRGAIYLADRDLARKLGVEIVTDTTNHTLSVGSSQFVETLRANLRIPGIPVTLGEDIRLRSAEANVRLAGQLTLAKTPAPLRNVVNTAEVLPNMTLEGQLVTQSGTYNLNLGVLQREFQVLDNGLVTFDGPWQYPAVDIRAQYNVKQYRERELGVIVHLFGRMPNPVIEFSSNADYAISTSDILSYLLIGRPGFDFAGSGAQTQQFVASFLPTLSAYTAEKLRSSLGFFDVFQFQFGTNNNADASASAFSRESIRSYLYNASVEAGRPLTNNIYVSANAGFCGIAQGQFNSFGAKVEYRFLPSHSLQAGYDPPTRQRSCAAGEQSIVGLVPTPGQFSFSLSHTWRF
jgi:translocation and assembly module TamB